MGHPQRGGPEKGESNNPDGCPTDASYRPCPLCGEDFGPDESVAEHIMFDH